MRRNKSNKKAIVAVVVIAAVALVLMRLTVCSPDANIPRHPYDWTYLSTDGDIKSYTTPGGESARLGIDVSYHNGTVNWRWVAASGIDFAYVRVGWRGYTEGQIHEDPMANANLSGAMSAGVDCGAYFFSQAITPEEAREEANFACDFVERYGIGDFPVVLDMEENNVDTERIAGLSRDEFTNIAIAFCEQVQARGFTPMIYGNDMWLNGHFDLATIANRYPLWLAEYDSQPEVSYDFRIWQYTGTATVDGVQGNCDLNLMFPRDEE